jgi:hypothetical protein
LIPFDLIIDGSNVNRLARYTRIGKIYKIINITKLIRLIKSIKARNSMSKQLTEVLKINQGFGRVIVLAFIFLGVQHLSACIW